jgi:hypothetical protein
VDEDGRLTAMGGPGDHPGMARKAAAGPMDAGSLVVATTSTTIMLLLSASVAGVAAAPPPRPPRAASTCSAQYRRATTRNRSACLAEDARGRAEWLAAPWEAAGRERLRSRGFRETAGVRLRRLRLNGIEVGFRFGGLLYIGLSTRIVGSEMND